MTNKKWKLLLLILLIQTCKSDKVEDTIKPITGYPDNIDDIITNKCATSGCHNTLSKNAAAGLDLSTWEKMFEGGRGGASVIPFRPDYSLLLYYTNTDSTQGLALIPRMPYNAPALSSTEYQTLKTWIVNGAPNKDGFVKFSDNPNRKKFYVSNQGCDVVSVFDSETKIAVRYISVGNNPGIEVPHQVKVSPDNQFWYTIFYAGNVIQKYRTSDNSFVGEVDISGGSWNTFAISDDSKYAFIVDWNTTGRVAVVNLETMTLISTYSGLTWPHGSFLNNSMTVLYLTSQYGNFIYKIDISNILLPEVNQVSLQPGQQPSTISSLDPHEIILSHDETKYYVSCQKSNEVRVFQTSNDSLLAVIPVGTTPVEMALSEAHQYLLVSCMEDVTTFAWDLNKRGSIAIINTNINQVIKSLYTGWQPHGIAIDNSLDIAFITNRNIQGGPAPHHASICGGRNGSVSAIDLNTLEVINSFKTEVSVDPYGIGITH